MSTIWTFIISTMILFITALAVWFAPIQAVKVGRKLSDKQNKFEQKMKLFLTLFSWRGIPVSYEFVLGLNQIEIIFQDAPPVLKAWRDLQFELQKEETTEQRKVWETHRVELLSKMAQDLGYNALDKVEILKYYYPAGFEFAKQNDYRFKNAEYEYHIQSVKFYDYFQSIYDSLKLNNNKIEP